MNVLTGKTAVITGGASGQGAAEARLFINEGAQVLLTDVDTGKGEALASELGVKAVFHALDVSDLHAWQAVASFARDRFGRVDILVNNAGINGYHGTATIEAEAMQRFLDVHVFGAMFGMQTICPLMSEGGSVINVASTAAVRGMPGYVGYGTSKWALRGLSRYAAHDYVGQNIRVNTVLPGGVDTPMLDQLNDNGLIDMARKTVPMRRFATAEELAHTVLFLASDQSSYMTGAELVVDGGLNA